MSRIEAMLFLLLSALVLVAGLLFLFERTPSGDAYGAVQIQTLLKATEHGQTLSWPEVRALLKVYAAEAQSAKERASALSRLLQQTGFALIVIALTQFTVLAAVLLHPSAREG